jgi:hypothetical protein
VETKDLIGLCLLFVATFMAVGVACVSQRARDAAFFGMVSATVITQKLDINFLGQFWYRGTTRGVEVSFVDVLAVAVLVSSFLVPRPNQTRGYWPASFGLMLLFFLYVCFSVAISEPRLYGVWELSKMVRGFIFFLAAALFVRSERELTILALALGCAVCFEGALCIKQRFLDGVHRVTGSLEHANSFSMYLCLVSPFFVAAVTSTLRWYVRVVSVVAIGFSSIAILLTISRAGIPIYAFVMLGATALCVTWRITPKKIVVTTIVLLAIAGMLQRSWDTLKDRFVEATFEEEYLDTRIEGRGFYLRLAHAIMQDRFFGVGLNNWSYWVSKTYGPRVGTPYEDYDDLTYEPSDQRVANSNYAAPAHNLLALTVGELGVPGLVLFALLWMRWFHMGFRFLWKRTPAAVHRIGVGLFFGLCGVFLQSVTEWTFRQTHVFLTFNILVGVLASLCWIKRKAKQKAVPAPAPPAETALRYEPVGA